MKPSDACREFIKGWEACRLVRYPDAAGHPSIGWGHLLTPGEFLQAISKQQADELFNVDLDRTSSALDRYIIIQPSQQQADALYSIAFNCGVTAIANSHLMAKFNDGDATGASWEFLKWDHAGGVEVEGLRKRRDAERKIFVYGTYDSSH